MVRVIGFRPSPDFLQGSIDRGPWAPRPGGLGVRVRLACSGVFSPRCTPFACYHDVLGKESDDIQPGTLHEKPLGGDGAPHPDGDASGAHRWVTVKSMLSQTSRSASWSRRAKKRAWSMRRRIHGRVAFIGCQGQLTVWLAGLGVLNALQFFYETDLRPMRAVSEAKSKWLNHIWWINSVSMVSRNTS